DMLGMVVSTGVGGGLILNGRLVNGRTGNAGHIGHVVVEPVGGPRCGCGGHGCLEAVARGPALTDWALAQGWTPRAAATGEPSQEEQGGGTPPGGDARRAGGGVSRAGDAEPRGEVSRSGGGVPRAGGDVPRPGGGAVWDSGTAYREDRPVTGRALAADALAGDPVALRAMSRAGRAIGIAIASATHLCDLDLVTIGGGLSQAGEPLFGPLNEALREHARVEFARRVEVVPAALGQEAGLVGAAALIIEDDSYWSV
ncbi:ROK family protein, partial [Nonomuraea deserti]